MRWVKLEQRTEYPESEHVEIRVDVDAPVEFALRLRIPAWLKAPELPVNGKRILAVPGTFSEVRRQWRKGDRVELTLPFTFRAAPIDEQHRDTVAVMRGPLMLAAVDPPERLPGVAEMLRTAQAVSGSPLEFDCDTLAGKVRLRPFYKVQREPYSTYLSVT